MFQMNSKHHFGAINGQKPTKIHLLEPKMVKICSKQSKIQTSGWVGVWMSQLFHSRKIWLRFSCIGSGFAGSVRQHSAVYGWAQLI